MSDNAMEMDTSEEKSSSSKSRYFYFDTMRTLSIYAVLLAHVYTPWKPNHNHAVVDDFPGFQLLKQTFSFFYTTSCVNVFFMISGALLFQRQESLTKLYIHRVIKMLTALLTWRLFTFLVDRYWLHDEPKTIDEWYLVNHLWFLSTLIPLYMLLPFYRLFFIHAPNEIVVYMLILWMICVTMSYPFHSVIDPLRTISERYVIHLDFFIGQQGYMLYGAFIQRFHTKIQNNRFYFVISFCIYLLGNVITNYGATLKQGRREYRMEYAITPSDIIRNFAAFVWLMAIGDWLYQKFPRLIASVSSCSFGIYLSHKIILKLFQYYLDQQWLAYQMLPHPILYVPVVTTSLLFLSWGFVSCVRRIEALRYFI